MLKKTAKISAVLSDLIKSMEFKIKHRNKETFFTRTVKLTFSIMMNLMIKKSNKSIQNSLNDIKLNGDVDYTITNSAYTQARAKLNYTAFEELSNKTVELFYKDGEYNRFKNFRILAVDGSIVTLPNSEDIKKEFNPTIVTNGMEEFKKEVIQSRVSALYDVLNNIALHATINNACKNKDNDIVVKGERVLALEHLQYCTKEDLVTMDRGYPSYELFSHYNAITNYLIRMPKSSFLDIKFLYEQDCTQNDVILEITAPKYIQPKLEAQNLPLKMKIRFIRVVLNNGTIEVLATNVLDNTVLQTTDFKELYALRWGIELYYDILKNRLSLENFTGLTALAIKQDFYATVFLTNYEAMLVYDTNLELQDKQKDNKYAQQVNKAISFNAIKHKSFDIFYSNKNKLTQMQELEELFLTNTVTIRPKRKSLPRIVKYTTTAYIKTINYIKRKKKNVGN
jgi:hypothetical protein